MEKEMDKPTQRVVSKLELELKKLKKKLKRQTTNKGKLDTEKKILNKEGMLKLVYQQNRDARSSYILPDYLAS